VSDACSGGVCGGADRDCSELTDACNLGTCSESLQGCEAQPTNDGGACDDQDDCTVGDACSAGQCQPGAGGRDADGDGSVDAACGGDDCDDGNRDVHPDAPEDLQAGNSCADALDNDCDGATDKEDGGCVTGDWWEALWTRRRRILVNNPTAVAHTNVPVLVKLTPGRIDYLQTGDFGHDLRFVDQDGLTELDFEIEQWSKHAESFLWVRVPEVAPQGTEDWFWMYYGHPQATDAQDAAGVWMKSYEAVYHLNHSLEDSTGRLRPGTDHGSWDDWSPLGRGRGFDGSSSWVDLGSDLPLLQNASAWTVSVLVRPDWLEQRFAVSASVHDPGTQTLASRMILGVSDGDEVFVAARSTDDDDVQRLITDSSMLATGEFYYLVGRVNYETGRMSAFVDGVQAGWMDATFSATQTSGGTATNNSLASEDNGGSPYFSGVIDEVRIARVLRRPEWITVQNRSLKDELLTFEDEESHP
jgi:hypothetical protein